jgi:integrase
MTDMNSDNALVPLPNPQPPVLRAKPLRLAMPSYRANAPKLSDHVLAFVASLRTSDASENTVRNYDTVTRQFLGYVLQVLRLPDDLASFNGKTMASFVQFLAANGRQTATRAQKVSVLKMFGAYLMRQEDGRGGYLLDVNPADRIEKIRRVKQPRPHLNEPDLIKFLLVDLPQAQDVARLLLVSTVLRASELCRLNVEDLVGNATDGYGLKVLLKGRRYKTIALPTDVGDHLMAWFESRGKLKGEDPILVNNSGQRYRRTTLSELYTRIGRAAGVKTRVASHIFRHSLNVLARRIAKLDVQARAELLNHANTQTIASYDHLDSPDEGRAAREAVWNAVKGLVGK